MTNEGRFQELKKLRPYTDPNGNMFIIVDESDYNWLIEHVQKLENRSKELEYVSKNSGKLNEFLQERKLPPSALGRHVADVVMNYVEELEKELYGNNHFMGYKKMYGSCNRDYANLRSKIKHYKQGLEDILKEGTIGKMVGTGEPVRTREACIAEKILAGESDENN